MRLTLRPSAHITGREGMQMSELTLRTASHMIQRWGAKRALQIAEEDRERNSCGTYSYAYHNDIAKAIRALAEVELEGEA